MKENEEKGKDGGSSVFCLGLANTLISALCLQVKSKDVYLDK